MPKKVKPEPSGEEKKRVEEEAKLAKLQIEHEAALINLVREKPCLYNQQDAKYRDNNLKTKLWAEIAPKSGISSGAVASNMWQSLRKSYRLRREKVPASGSGSDEISPMVTDWAHWVAMDSFMHNVFDPRPAQISTLPEFDKKKVASCDIEYQVEIELDESAKEQGHTERTCSTFSSEISATNVNEDLDLSPITKTKQLKRKLNDQYPVSSKKTKARGYQECIPDPLEVIVAKLSEDYLSQPKISTIAQRVDDLYKEFQKAGDRNMLREFSKSIGDACDQSEDYFLRSFD